MKFIKIYLFTLLIVFNLEAKMEPLEINFQDLTISDLIKITSKIIDKNILLTNDIPGKVNFISNKPLYEKDIYNILIYTLQSKGFTIVENNGILRVVSLNDSTKLNVPVVAKVDKVAYNKMVTKVFDVQYSDVDSVASKVQHLTSPAAKLVTDKNSNTIVITDFEENIQTIQKIVSMITQENKKHIVTIKLKNIQANRAQDTLLNIAKSIFNQKIDNEITSVIANADNNSVLITGKKSNVEYLAKYIQDLDKNDSAVKRVVEVVRLKNEDAQNVIKIIDSIVGKKIYIDMKDKPLSSVDEGSNSIVIMGPKNEVEFVKELINKLDIDKPQVYVQAKIIEVNENKANDIGFKYGLTGGSLGNDGLFTFASSLGGSAFAAEESTLSRFLDFNSLALQKGLALGATINLLKQNQAIDIVSEPSILCINNQESSIYVGETKSFKTGATTTTASSDTTNISYKREDVGLTLKVKPRISNDHKVTLDISAIVEDAKELKDGQENPDTSKKEIKATAIITHGEDVIFGGYIKNTKDVIDDKVPLLGDIPVLGHLFSNKRDVSNRINLVIIITPYIIPTSKDLQYIKEQLAQLKILEDKYTNTLKTRLQERLLEKQKNQLESENKLQEIKNEIDELNEDRTKNSEIEQKKLTNEQHHQKILHEMFGI